MWVFLLVVIMYLDWPRDLVYCNWLGVLSLFGIVIGIGVVFFSVTSVGVGVMEVGSVERVGSGSGPGPGGALMSLDESGVVGYGSLSEGGRDMFDRLLVEGFVGDVGSLSSVEGVEYDGRVYKLTDYRRFVGWSGVGWGAGLGVVVSVLSVLGLVQSVLRRWAIRWDRLWEDPEGFVSSGSGSSSGSSASSFDD